MVELILVALLIVANGLLAMSEIAVVSSRRGRLAQAAERGDARAAAALRLAADPTRFLSTVQVGITVIGVLSGAFGGRAIAGALEARLVGIPALAPYATPIALTVVVLLITYFSLVIGELVPKRLALSNPERVARAVARPMTMLASLGAPAVALLSVSTDGLLRLLGVRGGREDEVSEEDIRRLVALGAQTGVLHAAERELVERVFRAADLRVSALMVPRREIEWIAAGASPERVRITVATSPHSHFPVCRGGLESIVGVVHVKDLVKNGLITGAALRVEELAQPPLFVAETTPALRMLDLFQERGVHVAFVVDEYGSLEGLVTLNDIVESIIGELPRRGEPEEPDIVARDADSWLVDGRATIHDLLETIGIPHAGGESETDEDEPDADTVAGLVLGMLRSVPTTGATCVWRGLRLEVVDMDGHRVDKVMVTRLGGEGETESGSRGPGTGIQDSGIGNQEPRDPSPDS